MIVRTIFELSLVNRDYLDLRPESMVSFTAVTARSQKQSPLQSAINTVTTTVLKQDAGKVSVKSK